MSRYCPICETDNEKFNSFGLKPREDALCPTCGSLEIFLGMMIKHKLPFSFLCLQLKYKDIRSLK